MNGVVFGERAAYLTAYDVLVVADPHVGRGESSAVSVPLGEREDLTDRLSQLVRRFDPETVIVAGDVVHTFDRVSDRSAGTLDALRDVCAANETELELVAGNHDTALATAWDGPIHEAYVLGGASDDAEPQPVDAEPQPDDARSQPAAAPRTVICHGHEPPSTAADRYVFGHVHPAIEIEGDRRPCFLHGNGVYRFTDVLLLPAFSRLAPGVAINDVRAGALDSPLLADADRLSPIVYDSESEEPFRFPPLGEFRQLL